MQRSVSQRWARQWATLTTTRWRWVILFWVSLTFFLVWLAPSWKEVAYDGDFEYLPTDMNSFQAGRLLNEAFPGDRSRSQIVLVLGREAGGLIASDDLVGLDLLRRLYHRLGEVSWQRAIDVGYDGGKPTQGTDQVALISLAIDAFGQAISLDQRLYEQIAEKLPESQSSLNGRSTLHAFVEPRLAIAYWDRGRLLEQVGGEMDTIEADYEAALILEPSLPKLATPIEKRDLSSWNSLIDVLAWEDPVIGPRLSTKGAKLAVLQLSSELAATSNIQLIESIDELIEQVEAFSGGYTDPGLQLLMTGSAAIGGETLIAARDAIRYTEWITVAMILLILTVVYRAPMLIAIPMISIGVAVVVSMSMVALLTRWSIDGIIPGLDMRVFTTSRIFIVVILFGAGTDYCLFLIARLREEAIQTVWPVACRNALSGVMGALLGSALTTIVGLGMLFIAEFGKFHYTGPIIAICLLIGLIVCTTLTPALLYASGSRVFWPTHIDNRSSAHRSLMGPSRSYDKNTPHGGLWSWIALLLTRYPATALLLGGGLLIAPAIYGLANERSVTYDLSSQLNHSAMSRQGLRLLAQHFDVGEINPVTVLIVKEEATSREQLTLGIKQLTKKIYSFPGVATVRTADDPLGDFPPTRDMGLLSRDAWRRRALKNHRIAQDYFYSNTPQYKDRLARLDVIVQGDPFSLETSKRVGELNSFITTTMKQPGSTWIDSAVLLSGTTPSIIDLRSVTISDNRRIKIAVVLAVFAVLVVVLRRIGLSLYLIATVLVSYYATLGLTILFFKAVYGSDYVGLDWKLPLFLFVILVAVGQDYNVYLVTRVLEEQRRLGWIAALRRAVSRTGGIITACGLVMAATFFSMTSSVWIPAIASLLGIPQQESGSLRGIVELGFALGLGVLIDTFYVRTVLVPSFIALVGRFSTTKSQA